MAILALDTVSATCSVTVRTPAGSISIRSSTSRQQAEILLPSIDKALELAGISKGEITAVATAQGPGSFTGLRLSYAAAKAICLSANAAFIPIPTLTAYAYPFNSWGRAVVSVLDAKKNRFYAQVFRGGVAVTDPLDAEPSEIAQFLDPEERALVVGPDAARFSETYMAMRPASSLDCMNWGPACLSEVLAEIAESNLLLYTKDVTDYSGPLYVRKSDAETERA